MKVNIEASNIIGEHYSEISPIDLKYKQIGDNFDEEINIKINDSGNIYINGELMIMLRSIIGNNPTVFCNFNDFEEWDKETDKMIPALPKGGISIGVGDNIFDYIIEEFGDKGMWKRLSFKELFADLVGNYRNHRDGESGLEKARQFIIDSFDEAVAELNE